MRTAGHVRFRAAWAQHAYSLIELLVVLAVVALMVGLATPSIIGALRGYQLDTGAQIVVNQLTLARQTALTGNHAVEVWFFQLPDYSQASSSTPGVFRGIQSFIEGDPTTATAIPLTAVTKPVYLPAPVIISGSVSPAVSPLLTGTTAASGSGSPVTLPVYAQNFNYVVVRFRPDGTTSAGGTANSLTLVLENDAAVGATGLPKNYETLSIDPVVGTVRAYRP